MISEYNQKQLQSFGTPELTVIGETVVQLSDTAIAFGYKNILTGNVFLCIMSTYNKILLDTTEFHNLRRYCDIHVDDFS